MTFSDETLIAYTDGELDADTRAAVEAATASDPEVARRLVKHLALAGKVRAAYDPVLREPVPQRLKDVVSTPVAASASASANAESGGAIDIATARMVKAARAKREQRSWTWRQWSAIAATLVLGVWAGRLVHQEQPQAQMAMQGGGLVARGALERALSTQLAGAQTGDEPVRIGISFRAKSGEYCRTFTLSNETSGLGCKAGPDWRLPVMAHAPTAPSSGAYRMAAGELPPAVVREMEQRIAGHSLDAREEEAAQRGGWR